MKILIYTSILVLAVCFSCKKKEECINGYAYMYAGPCSMVYLPVCGCDNITYTNLCHAINADLSSWTEGERN